MSGDDNPGVIVALLMFVAVGAFLGAIFIDGPETDTLERFCTHQQPDLTYDGSRPLDFTEHGSLQVRCVSNDITENVEQTYTLEVAGQ